MPQAIFDNARDGDVVLCMGAGSVGGVPAKVIDLAPQLLLIKEQTKQAGLGL